MTEADHRIAYLVEIIDSVMARGLADSLAGSRPDAWERCLSARMPIAKRDGTFED